MVRWNAPGSSPSDRSEVLVSRLEVLATVKAVNEHLQAGASLKMRFTHSGGPRRPPPPQGRRKLASTGPKLLNAFGFTRSNPARSRNAPGVRPLFAYVMRELLEALPGASNGKALLTANDPGRSGSRSGGAHRTGGAPISPSSLSVKLEWIPVGRRPRVTSLVDIKGRKALNAVPEFNNAGQAIPLKDANSSPACWKPSPRSRWRLAVGLVGVFGLRPVELNYCRLMTMVCGWNIADGAGCSPKRTVEALDPVGAPGMGAKLLWSWQVASLSCRRLGPRGFSGGWKDESMRRSP